MRHFLRGPRYGRIPKAWIEHHSLLTTGIPWPCLHTPPAFFTHILLQTRVPSSAIYQPLAPFQYPLIVALPCSMFPQRGTSLASAWCYLCRDRSFDSSCSPREKQRTSTDCADVNNQDQVESLTMRFFPQVECISSGGACFAAFLHRLVILIPLHS